MRASPPREAPGSLAGDTAIGRIVRIACAVAALAVVASLLGASLLALDTIGAHVDSLSAGDRGAHFEGIVRRMRLIGVGYAVVALVLLRTGSALDRHATTVARAAWASCRRAPRALAGFARSDPPAAIGLCALTVVASGLRLAYLGVPLRYDEATTWFSYVSKPLYVGLSSYSAPNDHLLNTALAKVSVTLLGDGPTALRLPALLAAVAAVPAAYALGHVLYGRAAALLAAGLVASSSTLVEYSANARGYSLVVLLTLLALIAAARVIDEDDLPAWAAVGAAIALGLYAVPTMLYAACGVLLWICISQLSAGGEAMRSIRRTGTCGLWITASTLALYTPVLVVSGPRAVTSNEFVTSLPVLGLLDRLPGHAADTAESWVRNITSPLVVVLAGLLIVSLFLTPRLSRFGMPPLGALLIAAVAVLLVQRAVPFTRVWLFCVPVAAVTVSGLLGRTLLRILESFHPPRTTARDEPWGVRVVPPLLALVVALVASGAVLSADAPRTSRETGGLLDAPDIASYLANVVTSNDRILATGSDTILVYYLAHEGVDAEPLVFGTSPRRRTFVVVNTLGKQTLNGVLADLGEPRSHYGPVRLLNSWKSAQVYQLERH